jgi:DNA polymerase III sliding clamp (beta) subunit (PCNA family)
MEITNLKPIIKRIVGGKYTRPVLSKILSDGQNLSVTDLETFIILKGFDMPKGLLDLESLGITNKVSELEVSEYPVFPSFKEGNKLTVSIKHIEMLLDSASTDETRLCLNGIAWIDSDLVSVDGHILTRIEGQNKNTKDSSIMPRTSIKELVNLCKKFKLSEVTIHVDDSFFRVDNEYFTLMGRIIAREFPKYKTVIPVKTSHEMTINNLVKLKDIKDILNRNKSVRLESQSERVNLIVDGTDFIKEVGIGEFKQPVGFNLKYLEFLVELDNKLMFNNELSPFMVTKENITRIAMPLKV